MSEIAKQLMQSLKGAAEVGGAAVSHLAREGERVAMQKASEGATELFAGIQTGNSFVLYGSNQNGVAQENQLHRSRGMER